MNELQPRSVESNLRPELLQLEDPLKSALLCLVAPSGVNLLVLTDQLKHVEPRGYSQLRRDLADLAGVDPEDLPISVQALTSQVKTLVRHGICRLVTDVPNPRRGKYSTPQRPERNFLSVAFVFPENLREIYAGYAGHLLSWVDEYGASQLPIMLGSSNTSGGYGNSAPFRRRGIYRHLLAHGQGSLRDLAQSSATSIQRISPHVNQLANQGILTFERLGPQHLYTLAQAPSLDIDLFSQTVPGKAGLRTLYKHIWAIIDQEKQITNLSASSISSLLSNYYPDYNYQEQSALTHRVSMVLRWIANHQPLTLISQSPSSEDPHTKVFLNPDLKDSVSQFIEALGAAKDSSRVKDGIVKGHQFTSDPQNVTKLIDDVVASSPRTKKE